MLFIYNLLLIIIFVTFQRITSNVNRVLNVTRATLNWVPSHLLGSALMHVTKTTVVNFSFMVTDRKLEVVGGSIPKLQIALKDGRLMSTTSMK